MPTETIHNAPLRILDQQGAALEIPDASASGAGEADSRSFGAMLRSALSEVDAMQKQSGEMVQRFSTGERLDIHQVMIAMEKASTAMALTMQVRNKLVDAYQEVMRTSV
jgi:flagellar hook-basal body complex protein FliE